MTFKTDFQREKESRDRQIYTEFITLSSEPQASATEVTKFLMKKYGIHSASTLWAIRKRVESSLTERKRL